MLSYLSSSTELSLYHLTISERHWDLFRLTIMSPLELLHCFGLVLQGHPTLSEKFWVFFFSNEKVFLFTVRSERESPRLSKLAEAIWFGGCQNIYNIFVKCPFLQQILLTGLLICPVQSFTSSSWLCSWKSISLRKRKVLKKSIINQFSFFKNRLKNQISTCSDPLASGLELLFSSVVSVSTSPSLGVILLFTKSHLVLGLTSVWRNTSTTTTNIRFTRLLG